MPLHTHNNRYIAAGLVLTTLLTLAAIITFQDNDFAADITLFAALSVVTSLTWRQIHTIPYILKAAWAGLLLGTSAAASPWLSPLVVPGLLLLLHIASSSHTLKSAALAGWFAGFFANLAGYSWLTNAFAHYADQPAIVGILFSLPWISILAIQLSLFSILNQLTRKHQLEFHGITSATIFVFLEILFFPLTPAPLAFRILPYAPLTQAASIIGVHGLTFLLILTTWHIHSAFQWRPTYRKTLRPLALTAAIVVLWITTGLWQLHTTRAAIAATTSTFPIAAIQANTPDTRNPTPAQKLDIAKTIVRLTAQTATTSSPPPRLIVFGESTAPVGFQAGYNPLYREAYQVAARQSGIPLVIDNIGYTSATHSTRALYRRESLVINPRGEPAQSYQKQRLIPIGEYLPGEHHLPILRKIFPAGRSYIPGTTQTLFTIDNVKIAPLLCYEILYPNLPRKARQAGARLIINPSNDSWFQSAKEARQHLWAAAFRSIENRLPTLRVANTGISATILQTGEIVNQSPQGKPWAQTHNLPLTNQSPLYPTTGHHFPLLCILVTLTAVIIRISKTRKQA